MRELNPWAVRSNGREAHRERYAAYMRSTAWFRRRNQWAADETNYLPEGTGIVCLGCGEAWSLGRDDLHHVTYDRLGTESHQDLWPLCRSCHTCIHRKLVATRSWRKLPRVQANYFALAHVRDERVGRVAPKLSQRVSTLRDYI